MINVNEPSKIVVVSGDPVIDWNLMSDLAAGDSSVRGAHSFTRICSQPGGALLLGNLVERAAVDVNDAPLSPTTLPTVVQKLSLSVQAIHPEDQTYSHNVSVWSRFPGRNGYVWRARDSLGIDRSTRPAELLSEVFDPSAQLVVIDDQGLDFRERQDLWPKALFREVDPPWVLLNMSRPVAQGSLWNFLHDRLAGRLIVVIPVEELRQSEVQISRELSWERTAQDVAWELAYNPRVNALADCAHVIVTFQYAGAVLLSPPSTQNPAERLLPECQLYFDPSVVEGMWEQENKGAVHGQVSCFMAALAWQMMRPEPDLGAGIAAGLAAMRALHLHGYEQKMCGDDRPVLAFPEDRVIAEMRKPQKSFVCARVQFPTRLLNNEAPADESKLPFETGMWTVLQEQYPGNLDRVSRDIVERGAEAALKNVPLGKFGKLLTVDRREIEGFRSIRTLILEYCSKKYPKRPLSIAVFGPPGSGKSFGIKQIAKSLRLEEIVDVTFNLSQMGSSEDLVGAFHRIRDLGLTGKIPLVFWDEFDSALGEMQLGWLRSFLAPMQDGEFLEGKTPHPIGRAIFVFAGGTCATIDEFSQSKGKEFKNAKGPDFVSRLRGYVNIYGANPPQNAGRPDPYYMIRRAILLRSVLLQSLPESMIDKRGNVEGLRIDGGVLRALLNVGEYKHGVRSMEAIIDMSQLAGLTQFERSSLPSEAQLNLHVNGLEFLSLVQSIALEGQALEKLAEANHTIFYEGLLEKGYCFGPVRDAQKKTHPLLIPYAALPEEYKQSNRDSVRDIANKLALVGYVMTPARSNEPPIDFPGEALERLAEMEHDRFMAAAAAQGWHYTANTEKNFPHDPTLLPWKAMTREEITTHYPDAVAQVMGQDALPEHEKDKDRELVKNIPTILSRVGYAVVKLRG